MSETFMNRYELLRKCAGAALLLKDAQDKLDQANRHLSAPRRKPAAMALAANGAGATDLSQGIAKSVSSLTVVRIERTA
jgi:hypothetical protein